MRALTKHPAFSMSNPNRVRSLITMFAVGNPTQFNRADGAGYEFIADTVLALDAANPQVAARMLSAFKSWRMLEPAGAAAPKRRCGVWPRNLTCRAMPATSHNVRWPTRKLFRRHRRRALNTVLDSSVPAGPMHFELTCDFS